MRMGENDEKLLEIVQGAVDLWSYIMPMDRYSHTVDRQINALQCALRGPCRYTPV